LKQQGTTFYDQLGIISGSEAHIVNRAPCCVTYKVFDGDAAPAPGGDRH